MWNQPVIGFNAVNGSLYANHPYSYLSNANEIACVFDDVSNYTSVIFKISSAPSPIQIQRQSCWRWYFNDIRTFGSIQFFYRFAPPCPCTELQANIDVRWNFAGQNRIQSCYVSDILPYELGQLCCYFSSPAIGGAPIVNGLYSGGFLLYHPSVDFSGYDTHDLAPRDLCCSVGLCDIFQQRRPLQTCSEDYQIGKLSKPHCICMCILS